MYSARCRRPWGTSQTDPRWRPRISQAEERERESQRTEGGLAEGAWGARLILSQLWLGQCGEQDWSCPSYGWDMRWGVEGGQHVPPTYLPSPLLALLPPPPQRSHRNAQRPTPPGWKEGKGEEWEVRGGGEEVTWTTAASQLIERPLGG